MTAPESVAMNFHNEIANEIGLRVLTETRGRKRSLIKAQVKVTKTFLL